ncbi:MAG TPA: hypothetical protein VFO79_06755 [Xanthomonadales bacterium]|nr:hypothetical protein [Xanthomonadales bacterium]
MSTATLARQDSGVCSHEWVLPRLDPIGVRRLRLCLAAWATSGQGNSRSWRMGTMLGQGGVHVVVVMPTADTHTVDVLDKVFEAIVPPA